MVRSQIAPGPSPRTGSQLDMLIAAASDAGLKHGDKARVLVTAAHARPIQGYNRGTTFFCNTRMKVLEELEKGDGAALPTEVEVRGLNEVPEADFDFEAIVESNGHLIVTAVAPPIARPKAAPAVTTPPTARRGIMNRLANLVGAGT